MKGKRAVAGGILFLFLWFGLALSEAEQLAEIQKDNIDLDNISDNTLELLEFKEVQENPDSVEN